MQTDTPFMAASFSVQTPNSFVAADNAATTTYAL